MATVRRICVPNLTPQSTPEGSRYFALFEQLGREYLMSCLVQMISVTPGAGGPLRAVLTQRYDRSRARSRREPEDMTIAGVALVATTANIRLRDILSKRQLISVPVPKPDNCRSTFSEIQIPADGPVFCITGVLRLANVCLKHEVHLTPQHECRARSIFTRTPDASRFGIGVTATPIAHHAQTPLQPFEVRAIVKFR